MLQMQKVEIVNMIVSSVPCPPLPMVGTYEESGEGSCFSSHSLVAQILAHVSDQCDSETQEVFTGKMKTSEDTLFLSLDSLGSPLDRERVYEIFCSYMRSLISASPRAHRDIRFFPIDHPCSGDPVHSATCDHARAQDVLFSSNFKGRTLHPDSYACSSYADLVLHYGARIVGSVA